LSGDVALNNTSTYFDGPSVAQGGTGTWWASGTVAIQSGTVGIDAIDCKLWDGTTIISSSRNDTPAANLYINTALSGFITSPAGNIRISCKDASQTTGTMHFNGSGNSKDSTISAHRIQ
jgi:hypothetical protein